MNRKSMLLLFLSAVTLTKAATIINNRTFPTYFKFGVGTAAYSVEGAWAEDGKSESIWDYISHTNPNFILNQDNGDVACDSYHHIKEDVAILKDLGVHFYKFSVSWSRVLPNSLAGTQINQLGIDYYRTLAQELIDNGIEPMIEMYHWDLPQMLQVMGGWLNPALEDHFGYYARVLFEQLGDLVKLWVTFVEPKQICNAGYGKGSQAPGVVLPGIGDYLCGHTVIKSHAKAYHIYSDDFRQKQQGSVGLIADSPWYEPYSSSAHDKEASDRIMQFSYGWFVNPIVYGDYPQVMIDRIDARSKRQGYEISRLPKFTEEEKAYIKGTNDFIAVNAYTTTYARWKEEGDINAMGYYNDIDIDIVPDADWEGSDVNYWLRIVPWGMRKIVNWIKDTYNNPEIFITANGFSDRGGTYDEVRVDYIKEYLSNLLDAILDDGVYVTRYAVWSLMDNLGFADGYTAKFGLYQVDFEDPDRRRVSKASASYYAQVINSRCLVSKCE